jgi:hypothetical protein
MKRSASGAESMRAAPLVQPARIGQALAARSGQGAQIRW